MTTPERITAGELLDRYAGFALDAYGVLVTSEGPVAGAQEFLDALRSTDKPFVVLTNDASRLPETSTESYRARGIEIGDAAVITSGSLLAPTVEERGLRGARCFVLGPEDAWEYARRARCVPVEAGEDADIVVVGDESGFPFLDTVDRTVSMIVRRCREVSPPELLLPNPDRIYPKGEREFGVASGAIAAMIEASLEAALGDDAPHFTPLGKPHAPIYEQALERLGVPRERVVMVGDQLETDIRGANAVGLASALVGTGVSASSFGDVVPTLLVPDLTID